MFFEAVTQQAVAARGYRAATGEERLYREENNSDEISVR
jgi:hypothetical protein